MADDTSIIKIQYDTDEAIKKINDLGVAIEANKKRQVDLKEELKNGKISQEQYNKQLAETTETLGRETFERKKYIKVIQSEAGSIKRAKTENQVLREERNKLNLQTKEGRAQLEKYNKKIDANTAIIKGNVDQQSKLYMSFGKIKESLQGLPGPLQGAVSGIGGMTKAALKFIATPIGAIIAAIVIVVKALVSAFQRSEERMQTVKAATAKLGSVFTALQKVLEPVVDFIVDVVIVAIDALGKAADKTMNFVGNALKKLGFNKAAEAVENFNNQVKEASSQAEALAKAEYELQKAQRYAQKTQLDYQRIAEKQRQIRDDESRSIDERIAANKELGKILQEQLQKELAIANKQFDVAKMRIKLHGETTANLDALAEAETNIADIRERITGQESEQLVNTNSLLKEKAELYKSINSEVEKRINTADDYNAVIDEELAAIDGFIKAENDAIKKSNEEKKKAYLEDLANKKKAEQEKAAAVNIAMHTVASLESTFSGLLNDIRDADLEKLRSRYTSEIEAAEAAGKDTTALKEDFRQEEIRLLKKQDKAARRQAYFKILLDTAAGVMAAIRQFGPPPSPLGIAGIASAGAIGAAQAISVKSAPQPTYESGGVIVNGKSHAQGGVNIFGDNGQYFGNVQGNEAMYVLKNDATAQINALSQLNESFGGRAFGRPHSGMFQDGGQMEGTDIDNQISRALQNTPIVVRVGDIETGLTDMKNVKQAGII